MGQIRSAREIAAEKIEKMGGLSAEEQRRLREQELTSTGTALAERFLSSGDERLVSEQLSKCGASDRPAVARALLERLLAAVELRARDRFEMVSKAIMLLPEGERLEPLLEKVRALFEQYRQAEDEARGSIDREGKEALHRMRVAGTAVAEINIRARPEWQQRLQVVLGPFAAQLDELKKELTRAVG